MVDFVMFHEELFDGPIEHVIVLEALAKEQVAKELAEIGVVGSVAVA